MFTPFEPRIRAVLIICTLQSIALLGILAAISEHNQKAGEQLLRVSGEDPRELSPVIQLASFSGITVQRQSIAAKTTDLNHTSAQLISGTRKLTDLHLIGQHVAALAETKRKLQHSIVGPLTIVCFALLYWLYPRLGMIVSFFSPIALAVSSIVIGTACITCGSTTAKGILLGPGILLLASLSMATLWNTKHSSAMAHRLLFYACIAAVSVQIGLILNSPLFCIWCVIVAVSLVATIISTQPSSRTQAISLYKPFSLLKKATVCCLAIGMFLHTTMAMGLRKVSNVEEPMLFLPVAGENILRYLKPPFTAETTKNGTFV